MAGIATSILIRLGGLAAMVGGVVFLLLWLLPGLLTDLLTLLGFSLENATAADNVVSAMLMLGAVAAIAAQHHLQGPSYGKVGALASWAASVGLALLVTVTVVGYGVTGPAGDPSLSVLSLVFGAGLLAATLGIVALGIATIVRGTLPWWCGVALIAGSPPSVVLCAAFLGLVGGAAMTPVGVGWTLVGYAVFRARGHLTGRPSRALGRS